MIKKRTSWIFSAVLAFSAVSAFAATESTQKSVLDNDNPTSFSEQRRYLLDPVEVTPVSGFSVAGSSAAFNVGFHAAYPLLSTAPLYAEPSFIVGVYSSRTAFNLNAGARYDIPIEGTKVRPFARVALGPTFQTSGSTAVFNAFAGGGTFFPISSTLELRAEAGLVNIDGNAGLQILGGVSL